MAVISTTIHCLCDWALKLIVTIYLKIVKKNFLPSCSEVDPESHYYVSESEVVRVLQVS